MAIGERVKRLRESEQLNQRDFASRLGTSAGRISEIESGKTMPGGDFLVRIHEEFAADLNWLLTGAEGAAAPPLPFDEQMLLDRYRASPQPLRDAALRVLLSGEPPGGIRKIKVSGGQGNQVAGGRIVNKGGGEKK